MTPPARPCLLPAQDPTVGPQLLSLIQSRFREEATLPQALALIEQGGGIARCGGQACRL